MPKRCTPDGLQLWATRTGQGHSQGTAAHQQPRLQQRKIIKKQRAAKETVTHLVRACCMATLPKALGWPKCKPTGHLREAEKGEKMCLLKCLFDCLWFFFIPE